VLLDRTNNNGSERPKTLWIRIQNTACNYLSYYNIICYLIDDFIFSGVVLLGDDLVQFQTELEAELVKLLLRVDLPQGLYKTDYPSLSEAEEPI
jgi:hypothetical protein